MTLRLVAFIVLLGVAVLGPPGPAWASGPPPPPPGPGCKGCTGPPPPPTPVATLAPPGGADLHVITVQLSPVHVRRGHTARLSVSASQADAVTVVVRYHRGKAVTYHGKVGKSGTLIETWKVAKSASLGKGAVQVTIDGHGDPFHMTLSFTVIR